MIVSRGPRRGYSLVELVIVCACILILTAMIVPVTRFGVVRQKEMELREALRSMRSAIDDFKRLSDQGLIPVELDTEGYPKTLEKLVRGRRARRPGQEEEAVPPEDPDRPDDGEGGVGPEELSGRAGLALVGAAERLRRVFSVAAHGPRQDEVQGLVMMRRPRSGRGFTLVELLVVMAILGILVAIAVPQLQKAPIRAKEATLREDLFTFRTCLDQYYADKGHYPETLQTLVTEKYIRKIPIDPFTKSADTWQVTMEEPDSSETASAEPPGIIDVKSGSKQPSLDKTPYNTW